MAQRSHVPKFGNWESDENVPYTAYFDKARKGKTGGKMINPNDPQENPDLVADYAAAPSGAKAEPEGPTEQGGVRRSQERRRSREDGDFKQFADSPARHDNMNRRAGTESAPQRHVGRGVNSGETHRRPSRQSTGSDNSNERSPLHHHAKTAGRGTSAALPAWEGKNSYDSSHGTPGRSRMRPKGDESPDKGAAVPKFGDWDESNPTAAESYTHIFNKVREERQTGAGRVPGMTPEPSYGNARKQSPSKSSKSCCFPWGRK